MKQSERPTYKIDREFNRLKKSMWEQKGRFCIYCGKPAQEFHHIVPRHAGGDNRPSNIVPLCSACHKKAHSRRVNEEEWKAGRKLIPTPENFSTVMNEYLENQITFSEALIKLGVKRSVFYRLVKEYKAETGDQRKHRNLGNRKTHKRKEVCK